MSDSPITHEISGATTRIDRCTDPDASRYAFGNVHVMPAAEGTVYLSASDSRILAVTKADGKADGAALMPPKLIGKRTVKMGRRKVDSPITLNGQWQTGETITPKVEEGRFPNCGHVLPDVSPEGTVTVRVDAALLAKLAEGITSDGILTLHIRIPEGLREDKPSISVIAAEGDSGFGALMPHDSDASRRGMAENYNAQSQAYREAWKRGGSL